MRLVFLVAFAALGCESDTTVLTHPHPAPVTFGEPMAQPAEWRADLSVAVPSKVPSQACGPGYAWVPPGPFLMGDDSSQAGEDEKPVHVVFVDGFCMQLTEAVDPKRPSYPAEGVSHAVATARCAADGGRLPTEAEWEKAARGGCELGKDPTRCDSDDLRPYPWGADAPSCELANHRLIGAQGPKLCTAKTLPVDSLPAGAGPYGHLHLSGNVWEYVADRYHMRLYRSDRPRNPGGPGGHGAFSLRGGGWNTFSSNMRVANRFSDLIDGSAIGFRCVKSSATPVVEDGVQPIDLVAVRGTIRRLDGGVVRGRALYVTAFDAGDADPASGMPRPGRSPMAEARVGMSGVAIQPFSFLVPRGAQVRISAAMDDGSAVGAMPASGSGGVGQAEGGAIQVDGPVDGVTVILRPLPVHPGPR